MYKSGGIISMHEKEYILKAKKYLTYLCSIKPDRRLGSKGNKKSIKYFSALMETFNFSLKKNKFKCMDFLNKGAIFTVDHEKIPVEVSPFSLPCRVKSKILNVTNIKELEDIKCENCILLLSGEICSEQLMPKNFGFYNPDLHQRIIALLERKKPAAIITATKKNPETSGARYPFPLIEDGDFNIPSVFCNNATGKKILRKKNRTFTLKINSKRIITTSSNIIAVKNKKAGKKIIICAHIDTKDNTPGALDNAGGIIVIFLLAEMLKNYTGNPGIEIIAFNGEDNYSAAGEEEYLKKYKDKLKNALFVINIDAAGYVKGKSSFTFYNVDESIEQKARNIFSKYHGLRNGEKWYQGDHSIFIQNGVSAIAITSEKFIKLCREITHTKNDKPELVDVRKLYEIASALNELIISF
jgi:aminopeptidase YwaD